MTIVAGFISPSSWGYIGADTAAVSDDIYGLVATPKVAKFGNTLVGFAGSFREGKRAFYALERQTYGSVAAYLERNWRKDDYGETEFLILEQGKVYELGNDGALLELARDYGAIGNGAGVALGAMGMQHISLKCLQEALAVVEAHVPQIRSPFVTLETVWL